MDVALRPGRPASPFGPGGALRRALVTALLYFGASWYVMVLNDPVGTGSGFWPGAGITVAALLLSHRSTWPAILVAVGLAEFLNDLAFGYGVVPSAWWSIANMAVPLVAASLVHWQRERLGGPLRCLVVLLLAAVVVAPLVGGLVGANGTVAWGTPYPYPSVVARWWIGDGLGILTITPLALLLRHRENRRALLRGEEAAVLAITTAVAVAVLSPTASPANVALPFLVLPPLMWAAARLGLTTAAAGCFVMAQAANLATAFGRGPFAAFGADHAQTLLLMQANIAIVTLTALLFGARTTESRQQARDLEAQRLREAQHEAATRHYQRMMANEALELHEEVVQALVTAQLAVQLGRIDDADEALRRATAPVQQVVRDLLTASRDGPIKPGDLRRGGPAPER